MCEHYKDQWHCLFDRDVSIKELEQEKADKYLGIQETDNIRKCKKRFLQKNKCNTP